MHYLGVNKSEHLQFLFLYILRKGLVLFAVLTSKSVEIIFLHLYKCFIVLCCGTFVDLLVMIFQAK